MSLETYQKKRKFNETSEPKGSLGQSASTVFVVQKHDASHLHYDLRLEMEGVLKSWAVPKEPTLNPGIKRLAVQTEDHPLEYQNFEGEIPEGNYGAGRVEIWDKGNFAIISGGLEEGHITFVLNGQKLKGEFALVRIKNHKQKNWLLIKANDEYATPH